MYIIIGLIYISCKILNTNLLNIKGFFIFLLFFTEFIFNFSQSLKFFIESYFPLILFQ